MITELSICNFKCFGSLTSIPMSRYTILYGKNGRGKSSMIQSLLLLSQSLQENGGSLDSLAINGKMVSLGTFDDITNRYSTSSSAIDIIVKTDIEPPLKLKFEKSFDKPTIGLLDEIWLGPIPYFGSVSEEVSSPPGFSSENRQGHKKRLIFTQSDIQTYVSLMSLYYIAADRRGPVNFEQRIDRIGAIDTSVKGDGLINALAVQSSEFRERFTQELSLILSGASVRVFASPYTPDRIELFLDSVNDQEYGFRPRNVGFGYSYVLPIVYQVLSAPSGGIIVIENPEAHLYPAAQSRLVDFLVKYAKEKNLQIVLETHSDHIINGLRISVKDGVVNPTEASILYFDRDENETGNPVINRIRIDKRGALDKQPGDFMDEWTRQMLELL